MTYANLLLRLPEELIKIFRKYEQETNKEINILWYVVFNKICLSEKIWPKFSNNNSSEFYLYRKKSSVCLSVRLFVCVCVPLG